MGVRHILLLILHILPVTNSHQNMKWRKTDAVGVPIEIFIGVNIIIKKYLNTNC